MSNIPKMGQLPTPVEPGFPENFGYVINPMNAIVISIINHSEIGVLFTNYLEDEHLLNNSTNIALENENHHEQVNINYKSSIYTMAKLSKTGAPLIVPYSSRHSIDSVDFGLCPVRSPAIGLRNLAGTAAERLELTNVITCYTLKRYTTIIYYIIIYVIIYTCICNQNHMYNFI